MCTIEFAPNISPIEDFDPDYNEVYSFRKANYSAIRDHLSAIDYHNVLYNHEDDMESYG